MKRLVLCVTVIVLTASSLPAEVRTWSSANGKFSVQAELVEVVDGKARLRKEDGQVIAVPIAKLSSVDRKFLMKQQAQASGADTVAATNSAAVKPPAGLKVSTTAQWASPPPPLVVEVSILGKTAAEATSYGNLKLTKATSADGADMKCKKSIGPGRDPVQGFVKIDRKNKFFSKHPKDGVLIALQFERPKGDVTKTGRIEGSVELLSGGKQQAVVVASLAPYLKKTIANASLKTAGVELKLTKRDENSVSIQISGKQQNLVDIVLIDKNGKPIKTMGGSFQMGGGPITRSFDSQKGSLPADVGLRATVVVGSKPVVVPFAVSGLKIEQPNTANHTIPFFGK